MSRVLAVLLGIALAGVAWLVAAGALSPAPTVPVATTATPAATRAPASMPPRLRCPDRVVDCASVRGRVIFVESVDPDGDGDLHVVLAAGRVTGPGLTAVDIRPGLRPRRDPVAGDVVSAMGPVQRGSFGQSQIHALRVRFSR
jgi:hypothetical protein